MNDFSRLEDIARVLAKKFKTGGLGEYNLFNLMFKIGDYIPKCHICEYIRDLEDVRIAIISKNRINTTRRLEMMKHQYELLKLAAIDCLCYLSSDSLTVNQKNDMKAKLKQALSLEE